jgi:SAM-dependent methyltransferase
MYKNKYLKYKNKYIKLKNQIGGNPDCLYLNNTLTDGKIIAFKQKLDDRSVQEYKNWLVIYAGYNTIKEKIRFKNPNWIFWDMNNDERYSIKGLFNEDNLIKLDTILGNTFDYICFDDDVGYYYNDDKEKIIYRLLKILKPNGVLVIKNVVGFNDINDDGYAQLFFLSKKSRSTPYGSGRGGTNLLNDIISIVQHIKEQNIKIVNLSKYENINILISIINANHEFASNFDRCNQILNGILNGRLKNLKSNNALNCMQFMDEYKFLLEYYESNKEKLKEEYQELLGKVAELWSLPNYANAANDTNENELYFIKKLDYPPELYS